MVSFRAGELQHLRSASTVPSWGCARKIARAAGNLFCNQAARSRLARARGKLQRAMVCAGATPDARHTAVERPRAGGNLENRTLIGDRRRSRISLRNGVVSMVWCRRAFGSSSAPSRVALSWRARLASPRTPWPSRSTAKGLVACRGALLRSHTQPPLRRAAPEMEHLRWCEELLPFGSLFRPGGHVREPAAWPPTDPAQVRAGRSLRRNRSQPRVLARLLIPG